MIISLTGFMGCGKSSVGRRLSQLLCCPFMDLDTEIEARAGCTVAEIFARDGEAEFRRIEQDTLSDIIGQIHPGTDRSVLALGGGAVMTEGSAEMVHDRTICIYLKASVDTLMEHLTGETSVRPMLKDSGSAKSDEAKTEVLRSRILELMSLRAETYEHTAHHVIDTDGKTVDEIAQEIIDLKL